MFAEIDTPALILDAAKVERNCRRMRERMQGHGVVLRPHVKTAKCVEVTQFALGAPQGAITVSRLHNRFGVVSSLRVCSRSRSGEPSRTGVAGDG